MKNSRILTFSILALFALNLGTLLWLVLRSPGGGRPHGGHHAPPPPQDHRPDGRIREVLQWTPAQEIQFDSSKSRHHRGIMAAQESQRATTEAYFNLVLNPQADSSTRDSLLHALQAIHTRKLEITWTHFAELYAICEGDQKTRFASLLPELIPQLMGGRPPGVPPGMPPGKP